MIRIDKEQLLKELDQLIAVNDDAGFKADALAIALTSKEAVAADGVAQIATVQAQVDSANEVAQDVATTAEVESRVADSLLTAQINHLKALVSGLEDDEDPTP